MHGQLKNNNIWFNLVFLKMSPYFFVIHCELKNFIMEFDLFAFDYYINWELKYIICININIDRKVKEKLNVIDLHLCEQ